ncbi:peroxiredoxin-like family protein [Jongsikchunia kroppenstedtii]|uniref:peroxiredoxin-like family protein n=1 Tax=Jongsikchunia kroppenstedtii TaxID=1121721 RepID=UPI00036C28AF|nr:peroxiredoxin-like family protein [Jongsikchunia kroppenstedtii]
MSRIDIMANERLLDDRHHLHEFRELWADGPVAFVFLRQFGSAFALEQARSLNAYYDEIAGAGARVVFIGLGTPIEAFTFRKRAETRFMVLATHDQTLYRTMGLWRYRVGTLGPANLGTWAKLIRAGVYPYQRTGDPYQLGGVFVATAGGAEVVWDYRAHKASDIASAGEIARALVCAAETERAA